MSYTKLIISSNENSVTDLSLLHFIEISQTNKFDRMKKLYLIKSILYIYMYISVCENRCILVGGNLS